MLVIQGQIIVNLSFHQLCIDTQVDKTTFKRNSSIPHFRNEKGTGAVMCRAIVSGIVTGDMLDSYWPIFFPFHGNSPRSLCES